MATTWSNTAPIAPPGRAVPAAPRWDVYRWDAAAVMFFPGRGREMREIPSVVQRFDVDSVHHRPAAVIMDAGPGDAPDDPVAGGHSHG